VIFALPQGTQSRTTVDADGARERRVRSDATVSYMGEKQRVQLPHLPTSVVEYLNRYVEPSYTSHLRG
jgi:hypothetical protein